MKNKMPADVQAKQSVERSPLYQVTPLSKYLSLALFIILPFVGGYIGYSFAPMKVVEKEVVREVEVANKRVVTEEAKINNDVESTYTLVARPAPELREYDTGPDPEQLYLLVGEEEIFLKTIEGGCDIKNAPTRYLIEQGWITDYDQIVSHIPCWFAGGGSATYLVKIEDEYKVLHYKKSECGRTPCSPNGEIEVLY